MRELYNEFFHIPKHGRIREKVMLARRVLTIAIVIVCLVAMSITAYAYFSYNITSGSNIIKSATFKTEVQVQITDENGNAVETATPITSDHQSFKIEGLKINTPYTVSVKPIKDETTAKTGFVIVTADKCSDTYHTQQLGKDESVEGGETKELSFKLMITDSTIVYLNAHWGTSSHYDDYKNKSNEFYITQGKPIKLNVNSLDEPNIKTDSATEQTESVETAKPTIDEIQPTSENAGVSITEAN